MYFLADCPDGTEVIVRFIKFGVMPLFQFGIPIILIVLGSIDLGKAVIASDDKKVKEAQGMLIKRCIYAVAVFFVVTIVSLVFGIFASSDTADEVGGTASWSTCWKSVS
ncbi:MAG: hypothetical protein Q4G04_00655 [bacterium]|nr:hypothetical protein [bacterium]